jgi:hypothetical protein
MVQKMRKINKKGAFEIYNVFLLFLSFILMFVSLVTLFVNLSNMNIGNLGAHSRNILYLLEEKENNLLVLDNSLSIATPISIMELGKKGVFDNNSLYYFNIPVLRKSDIAVDLFKNKPGRRFEEIFTNRLNQELRGKSNFTYYKNSIFIENDTIKGYSMNSFTLSRSALIPDASVSGFWGFFNPTIDYSHGYSMVNYNPNFLHVIQGFSIENYENALKYIMNNVFDEFKNCSSEENFRVCILNSINRLNQANNDFEVYDKNRCLSNYQGINVPYNIDFYSMSPNEIIFYEIASKLKECILHEGEVICEIKIDVPLKTNQEYSLSNIFTNGDGYLNISYFSPVSLFNNLLISEKIVGLSFITAKDNGQLVTSSELYVKTHNSNVLARDQIRVKLNSVNEYTSKDSIFIYKNNNLVSYITENDFNRLKTDSNINIIRNNDFITDLYFICLKDMNSKIIAKVGNNYQIINPSYNFVIYTGTEDLKNVTSLLYSRNII